ncbi:MAG: hypothetical protein IJJ33_14665 [Victivallales bacterium]|nr:hypothetical protein [Victivallales bacterium]
MKGFRLVLAASVLSCLAGSLSAAPFMKVKMAETYLKTAEAGGFSAKSAAKEARQRIDELKKSCGENDPDVQALEKRLLVIEDKEKAAQEEKRASAQAERAKEESEKKSIAQKLLPAANVSLTAPQPWVLDTDYEGWNDKNPIKKYVKNLAKEKKEDVIELDKQLRARIEQDRKIVQADGPGKEEAEKEIKRYEAFLGALETPVLVNTDIKIDVEKRRMDFYYFKVFFSNFSRDIRPYSKKNGKCYFFGVNGEPEYVRENEIPYAQEALTQMSYICIFFNNQGNNDHYMQILSKAAVSCQKIKEAINNNSPDVVIYHSFQEFPKGALHDALAKEALALALPKMPNAVDVIINSNDWYINRNALGIILNRACAGWVVVQDEFGKRVIPAKWAQPNQGGDTYGKLQLASCGGNAQYYVK